MRTPIYPHLFGGQGPPTFLTGKDLHLPLPFWWMRTSIYLHLFNGWKFPVFPTFLTGENLYSPCLFNRWGPLFTPTFSTWVSLVAPTFSTGKDPCSLSTDKDPLFTSFFDRWGPPFTPVFLTGKDLHLRWAFRTNVPRSSFCQSTLKIYHLLTFLWVVLYWSGWLPGSGCILWRSLNIFFLISFLDVIF